MYQRGRFKVYQFQASPGRRYIATLQAGDFDAFLSRGAHRGRHYRPHADGRRRRGESTGSRLRFTLPPAGTYLVLAQSLGEDGTGAFTLRLDTATIRHAAPADPYARHPRAGRADGEDAEYDEDEGGEGLLRPVPLFRGSAGQRLRIRMDMGEYYPSLEVGTMQGGRLRRWRT